MAEAAELFDAAPSPAPTYQTDIGNAERFVARNADRVRFVRSWGRWLVWDGARWARDDVGVVERLAKESARTFTNSMLGEAGKADEKAVRFALASESERGT